MMITPSRPARLTTFVGYYGFIVLGCNLVLIPTMIRSIEHDFAQDDAALGVVFLFTSLLMAAGAFIGGMLTERIGRRLVLSSTALLLTAGLCLEAVASNWPLMVLAVLLASLGSGGLDGGINSLFLDLYRDARGGALNLLHLFFSIGSLLAPFIIGQAITLGVNWRLISLSLAVFAVLLASAFMRRRELPSGRHSKSAATPSQLEVSAAERSLVPFIGLAIGICFYVAAEISVSNWVVKLLSNLPESAAANVLSLFWLGLAGGRLLSNWLAERIDYYLFTISCAALSSLALLSALLVPLVPLEVTLFMLCGFFFGPIYPMIMALGGNAYPKRLATLSGGLAAAGIFGATIYPPLMGVLSSHIGLRGGMMGAAALGVPLIIGLLVARAAQARMALLPTEAIATGAKIAGR